LIARSDLTKVSKDLGYKAGKIRAKGVNSDQKPS